MIGSMLLSGGIAVFLLGLRFISENVERAAGERFRRLVSRATKSPAGAALAGVGTTALAQSSVAIDMAVVSLADGGVISFLGACAVVVGANIGTTVTAQLVSFSFSSFNVTAFGSLSCIFGFIFSAVKGGKYRAAGDIAVGFGLIFIGINVMTDAVVLFYGKRWFEALFSIESAPIMLLNGFFITAICQSSSVVSSILVILAADGKITFGSAVFLILGANVGSTIAVVNATVKRGGTALRVALFNMIFNAAGALLFIVADLVSRGAVVRLFSSDTDAHRAVANFHTFFQIF